MADDMTTSDGKTQPIRIRLQQESTEPTQPVRTTGSKLPSAEITKPVRIKVKDAAPTSLWKDAWYRLIRNPEGIFGIVVITVFVLTAIFADAIAPFSVKEIHLKKTNLPPAWVERSHLGYAGDPQFLLGTDRMGRDLLSWGVYGTRTSMTIGVVSAPLIALFGMVIGLVAGYYGGWLDNMIMRVTDVFYAFPPLMITIIVVFALRDTPAGLWLGGLFMFFLAFLSVGWAGAARLVRSSVLVIKDAEYIEAARCIGVPAFRQIFKHILPNCLAPLLVWTTLMVPQLILTEAILGYLRIGTGPAGYREMLFDSSWGGMIMDGRSVIHVQPITTLIPAFGVGLVSIAFTFLGDALRDALDPHMQKSRESQRF